MSEYGKVLEAGSVRFERVLPGPIERVWAYLTDSEKRGKWLASGDMDLRPGGAAQLRFKHSDLSPKIGPTPERFKRYEGGHVMNNRVIECYPPRRLAMSWGEHSDVTFELSEKGEDVLLVLTHRNLATRGDMINVSGGWHTHLEVLSQHLNGREPEPFWAMLGQVADEYERRLSAS